MNRAMLFVSLALVPMTLSAAERSISRSQVPAAAAATIDREAKGAVIKGYTTEREGGKTVYEAETVIHGHTRDLQVSPDGTLNEIEEEVQMSSLPTDVQQSLLAHAHGGDIAKIESLTKKGALVAYEAVVSRNGHQHEIQVGPHGEKLAREE